MLAADATATGSGSYQVSLTCAATPCGAASTSSGDSAGGQFTLGELDVIVPPNAITEPISVTLARLLPTPTDGLRAFSVQARTAEGQAVRVAQQALTYRMRYRAADLAPQRAAPANLRLALWDSAAQRWSPLESQVDAAQQTVTATSTQVGDVALLVAAGARTLYLPLTVR